MKTRWTSGLLGLSMGLALYATVPAFALELGDTAPCVQVPDLQTDGTVIDQCVKTKAPGHSFIYLEFFSTSCGDCQKTLPHVSALAEKIAATASVRLVGIDRDEAAIRLFLHVHREFIHFPVALDTQREAKEAYGVKTTPTGYLLDAQDRVIFESSGVMTDEDMAKIEALVGQPSVFND